MKTANLKTLDISACKLIKLVLEQAKIKPIKKTYTQMEIPFPQTPKSKQLEIQFPS